MMDDVDTSARADAVSVRNIYNLKNEHGIAMINIPQRFAAVLVNLAYRWLSDGTRYPGGFI